MDGHGSRLCRFEVAFYARVATHDQQHASAEIQKRYRKGVTKSEIADAWASPAPRRF